MHNGVIQFLIIVPNKRLRDGLFPTNGIVMVGYAENVLKRTDMVHWHYQSEMMSSNGRSSVP